MTPEKKREIQEKAAELRRRLEESRAQRAASNRRIDEARRTLRELAGRG